MLTLDSFQLYPTTVLRETGLHLRVWYNPGFLDVNGETVQAGTGTSPFYIRFECTITNGVITVESNDIFTTIDAQIDTPQSIQVFARLFNNNTARDWVFTNWVIPGEASYPGGVITYEQLTIWNEGNQIINPPDTYWTQQEIVNYFNTLSPAPNASALVKGLVRLTVPPLSATDPIAVGSNDPVVSPQSGGRRIYAAQYSSFANALAAASGNTLVVTTSMTVSANATVPTTTTLRREGSGLLSVNSGITLTFTGASIECPPNKQFFAATGTNTGGAGTGSVSFIGGYPVPMSPCWWGAVGDGTTDCLPAAKAVVAAMNTEVSGVNPAFYMKGAIVEFPPPDEFYLMTGNWSIYRNAEIRGRGTMNSLDFAPVQLRWNTPCVGMTLHRYNTDPSHVGTETSGVQIHGFEIVGTYAGSTGTADVSGLTITRVTGPVFNENFSSDYVITVHGYQYVVRVLTDADHLIVRKPRLVVSCTNGSPTIADGVGLINGTEWPTGDWDGQDIAIDGITYTILSHTASVITLTTNFTGATGSYDAQVQTIKSLTGVATTLNNFHGIQQWCQGSVYDCTSRRWSGQGYNIDSSTAPPDAPSGDLNSNYSLISRVSCRDNKGHGIMTRGLNSNDILIQNLDGTRNNGAGIMDTSFLGNTWIAPHLSFNTFGASFSNANICASTYIGMYSEGGQPSSVGAQYSLSFGGDQGAGWAKPNQGFLTSFRMQGDTSGYALTTPIRSLNTIGSYDGTDPIIATSAYFRENPIARSTFLGIGAGDDSASNSGAHTPASPGIAIRLNYGQPGSLMPGWYTFGYADPDVNNLSEELLAFSGSAAAEGSAKVWLPNGIHYLGQSKDVALIRSAANTLAVQDGSGAAAKLTASQLTSSIATGTAPLVVSSTTKVANLNVDQLDGADWTAPPAIGSVTPNTGTFSPLLALTTLQVSTLGTLITRILKGTVTIDPASINANTFSLQTFTLTGAVVGDVLTLQPPAAGLTSGILVGQSYISATDQITIALYNTTGGAIDLTSASWIYMLVRS